ncbi:penicillin-binding transpeptidase domain-containing protein [Kitasatospora sp. NPDC002227]|uniref:penicillin-binding transpeptidase domain-containing protein n=1 Tax=Kitasatospora sp. NPDC002227 TaxID=3154773 RepID=UPI00331990D9
MNKGVKIGLATVCTAMLGVGGYGAYNIVSAVTGNADKPKVRTVVAGPPAADQAAKTAKAFLDAWSKGDLEAAAKLTDKPDTALAALTAFKTKVNPSALTLTAEAHAPAFAVPTSSTAPTTPSSASPSAPAEDTSGQVVLGYQAKAEFAGTANAWSYEGVLGLVKMSDNTAAVHWSQHVIHPHLDAGESISVQPVAAQPGTLQDRKGRPIKTFDSLSPLLASFKYQPPADAGGAGTGVAITNDSTGKAEQLFTITDPKPQPSLKLTLDADLQRAAEAAVKSQTGHNVGLVAIEPSTGNVLAIANNPATGMNRAFLGAVAPGSTMKIITAAALLEAGVKSGDAMPCPPTFTQVGQTVKNDKDEQDPGASFLKDFQMSCNTAFLQAGTSKLKRGDMETLAKDAFGLGTTWKTGLPIAPPKVPAPTSDNQWAVQLMGQGSLQMSPLAMASVAATVQNGTFHQPVLVPGMEQQPAAKQLSSDTLDALRQMMRSVVTSGTAAGVGLPSGSGAKTGTAEVGNQAKPNSWLTAYSGDLAVAVLVEAGGYGADAAGPVAASVLKVGNKH